MKTRYEQIVDVKKIGQSGDLDLNKIFAFAVRENFSPAVNDPIRRLLLIIDGQKCFMEGGALGVPGSIGDVERLTRFIYNNMGGITQIMESLDTHTPRQIFFPCWWKNGAGDHPKPYTIITYDDVVQRRWRPVIGEPQISLEYLKELERVGAGKKQLCIWPYHGIAGTEEASLENQLAKMIYFHSVSREVDNIIIHKGQDPYSEMYGIIEPEYSREKWKNASVLKAIEMYDEIYIAGEAASHCLMESVRQLVENFANRPDVWRRITILEDCTSPIPGYETATKEIFNSFKTNYGIKIAKSTEIQF